mmetsp:Transcript_26645/g.36780  ORF Transcript_26645/g.36780 Transcript_26645/m.36780 type:complete len:221 (-) Transcript_26645:98-760(-)
MDVALCPGERWSAKVDIWRQRLLDLFVRLRILFEFGLDGVQFVGPGLPFGRWANIRRYIIAQRMLRRQLCLGMCGCISLASYCNGSIRIDSWIVGFDSDIDFNVDHLSNIQSLASHYKWNYRVSSFIQFPSSTYPRHIKSNNAISLKFSGKQNVIICVPSIVEKDCWSMKQIWNNFIKLLWMYNNVSANVSPACTASKTLCIFLFCRISHRLSIFCQETR